MQVTDIQKSVLRPDNSTNGHAISLPIPAPIRLSFQAVSRISPKLGGEMGRLIFFHPPRLRYSDLQRQILDRAERCDFAVRGRKTVAYGWGAGPVVLLLHGWGGHSGQMTESVDPLLQAGFRVIAVDLPAHGLSEGRLSSVVHFSDAITSAAQRFGPVHGAITHSLGGAGLVQALLNGLPVKRAVLISPQAHFHDYWRFFRNRLGMRDEVWKATVETSERWLGIPFAEVHPAVAAPKMTVPALILHGQTDRLSPIGEGRRLAALWPGARLVEYAETGHLSILREPRAIRAATAFMRA